MTHVLPLSPSSWQIETQGGARQVAGLPDAVPLTWAHDLQTGMPRYIHDAEVAHFNAQCCCPACDLPLTPVLAGHPQRRNPTAHFRHPKGAQKDDCTLVAARLAATRHLQQLGFIELPRRRMTANAVGFSGQGYEGWEERPAERVAVRTAVLHDHATALLTLDDGREILVDLTGTRDAGPDGQGRAVVTMSLSDPALAMMSPDVIRARLRLLPNMQWCAHWQDAGLLEVARQKAQDAARQALDAWDAGDEARFAERRLQSPVEMDPATAQQWRRESLLHREVKAILEHAMRVQTPSLELSVTRHAPEEFWGEWEENRLQATWWCPATMLEFQAVAPEYDLGDIVPDLLCTLREPRPYLFGAIETRHDGAFDELEEEIHSGLPWPTKCLIEVTVTHGIDEEKLRRIQARNLPTLEINIGALGGRVTPEGLRHLVIQEKIGKRWVHHPAWAVRRPRLESTLDQHRVTLQLQARLAELRRPRQLATPAAQWAHKYLAAVTEIHDTNIRIEKKRKTFEGPGAKPERLGGDSEPWQRLKEAADALAAHGLPGAADLDMVGTAGIVPRLLSIQHNRGVGYAVAKGYQVLNAIMQSSADYAQWHTLYPMAVKSYGLDQTFNQKQAKQYASWRQSLIEKVHAGDKNYLRTDRYDAVLGVLFPGMQQRLLTGYGRKLQSS